ncbi:MAG: cyclic nucleotide-binding domain-containing protein [Rhodospirillum sp.]|nr:cyclic nucleotide-binding domain-containing protein [Rhodospirillum sp.]MCF8489351.1 cyclic nucleotide-binding domain-containing protein [Rhodospirillum sp.]MCF8500707.1 cyclic nucleotide-binding domain-containing protein [Rhodospirillum sp.]
MALSKDRPLERRIYPQGQTIFRQDEDGDAAYIIEKGAVAILHRNEAGRDIHLGTLTPGSLFGEMAVIDGGRRMATAVVAEDTVLMRIPADQMRSKLAGADPFLKAVLKIMLENLRSVHGLYLKFPGNFPEHVGILKETTVSLERYCEAHDLELASPELGRYLALMAQALNGLGTLVDQGLGTARSESDAGRATLHT